MKVTVFIIFLFGFFFGGLVFGFPLIADNNVSDICETQACVQAADQIIKMRNSSINPCNDFYEFACGNYSSYYASKDDSSHLDFGEKISYNFQKTVKNIIKNDSSIEDPKYIKLAKTLYKACEDKQFDEIFKMTNDWPVTKGSQWNGSSFDLKKTIFRVGNTTQWANYFFQFYLNSDFSSIVVQPDTSLFGEDVFIDDLDADRINYYYQNIVDTASLLIDNMKYSPYNTNYAQDIKKFIHFEVELSRSRLTEEQMKNSTFDTIEMTLDKLTKDYSFFNWQEYISHHRGSPVDPSTKIVIYNFSYLKKLDSLLNSTEIKTIANYVMWKHLNKYTDVINYFSDIECIEYVSKKLKLAVGAIYIQSYNYSTVINAENNIKEMIFIIKKKMIDLIKQADWIDDQTKNESIRGLQESPDVVGYTSKFMNDSIINEYYKDLELYDDISILEADTRILLFDFRKILTLNNETSWTMVAASMVKNPAFYLPHLNAIIISYTILLSDIYNSEKPEYMNYGGLGVVIGHEITHAFEALGIEYNSPDPSNNKSWTEQNFDKKSQCFIDQYGNYDVPLLEQKVDGTFTIDENIADNGGMRAAYLAYNNLPNTTYKQLPGLSYNSKQMFWISYANLWCEDPISSFLRFQIDDEHSPAKIRVLGSLSNMPEFAEDFNCPLGSNMNPIKKCFFW